MIPVYPLPIIESLYSAGWLFFYFFYKFNFWARQMLLDM